MGLSYEIFFSCDLPVEDLAKVVLTRVLDAGIDLQYGKSRAIYSTVTLSGVYFDLDIARATVEEREFIQRNFSFEIDTSVSASLSAEFSTLNEGGTTLAHVVDELLGTCTRNLVFLFNYELVLLLRDRHGVARNATAGFWNENTRRAIRCNVREEVLPTI